MPEGSAGGIRRRVLHRHKHQPCQQIKRNRGLRALAEHRTQGRLPAAAAPQWQHSTRAAQRASRTAGRNGRRQASKMPLVTTTAPRGERAAGPPAALSKTRQSPPCPASLLAGRPLPPAAACAASCAAGAAAAAKSRAARRAPLRRPRCCCRGCSCRGACGPRHAGWLLSRRGRRA